MHSNRHTFAWHPQNDIEHILSSIFCVLFRKFPQRHLLPFSVPAMIKPLIMQCCIHASFVRRSKLNVSVLRALWFGSSAQQPQYSQPVTFSGGGGLGWLGAELPGVGALEPPHGPEVLERSTKPASFTMGTRPTKPTRSRLRRCLRGRTEPAVKTVVACVTSPRARALGAITSGRSRASIWTMAGCLGTSGTRCCRAWRRGRYSNCLASPA